MSIKHVQHDTMSHFLTDRASSYGLFNEALAQMYSAHDIYHSSTAETPEMILQVYKYSTFSKLQEFIEFQSRIENSLQKMIADREMIRLEFLREDSVSRALTWLQELDISNLKYDSQFCESRIDNRDTTVMLNWNPRESPSVEMLTRPAPQLGRVWMTLFTLVPRILKHMAHVAPIDAEYERLVAALDNLIASVTSSNSEQPSELTAEEVKLAKIISHVAGVFQILSQAIVTQNSNSSTKEDPAKTAATIKERFTAVVQLLKREPIKSTGVLPWHTFHILTTVVETAGYLNIVDQCLQNLIATKANKKTTFKAVNSVIQDFMGQCRQALQTVQADVNALKNVAKSDRITSGLLYEICDSSPLDFVRSPENQTLITEKIHKIGDSWMNSLANLQKEAVSRVK